MICNQKNQTCAPTTEPPNTHQDIERYRQHILPVLKFRDPIMEKGEGSYVYDIKGEKYLDLNSGQFCAIFGHSPPETRDVFETITKTYQDTDTATLSKSVLIAAKDMHDTIPEMDPRVIFLSTGAEAVECALRYAKHLKEKDGVIAFDKGYHGLTHGSAGYSMSRTRIRPVLTHSYITTTPPVLSADNSEEIDIEPYIKEFEQTIIENHKNIAAAIFEPIISGGGFYFPPQQYFQAIANICKEYDVFLIFDECQTGMGRTGSWFYCQQFGIVPDMIVAGKGLGMGFPVACVIANGNTITNDLFLMNHFSSHQNEPFAGTIVSHVIHKIKTQDLLQKNQENGRLFLKQLCELAKENDFVQLPRGKGLMLAFNINQDYQISGEEFCLEALNAGLLLQHCNFGKTIRLLPNYFISKAEIDDFMVRLKSVLKKFN